ncbi:MAG TPA: MATE family efflux transporter [Bryobacteraceae bacterium]
MQATVPENATGKWQVLREAIAGTEQDFTEGSLTRGIALLAIPTMLEMTMESTFGLVDAFWVARLGADAMAAVGLTESLIVLVFSVAMGLSVAATATVARRIGEKDPEGASMAAVQAIACGFAISALAGIVGVCFAPQLLGLMHADPGVIRVGTGYTRVLLGGNASIILLFLINGVFRGSGDAAAAMRTLWLANLINIVLDPCFIYGFAGFPKLGVMGAAVATTTGRSIGVAYQLSVLLRGRGRVAVGRRHLRLNWPVMRRLLGLARTSSLQYFIGIASWVSLARINAMFGSAAVAGYTIAIRIVMFALMPSWGICTAAATLVGQNLGAKKPERSERSVWLGGAYCMVFLTLVGIVFVSFAPWLVSFFTSDPGVAPIAVAFLRFVSLGYPFYAWGMIMEQAFNGAGDTATPTWINLFCYWTFQIPLAWYLSQSAGMGPRGVYIAICLAECLLAVVSVVLFRRGRWKTMVV